MPRDLGDLAKSAADTVPALRLAQRRGVERAALDTTKTIRTEIRKIAGGDMRLSGVGKRGARVNARYDVKGSTNPTALIYATGPLQLIERDTGGHSIIAKATLLDRRVKRGPARRRSGKKALTINGNLRNRAFHPGTRGQHPFERGWKKAAPGTTKIFRDEVGKGIKKAWGA